MQNGIMQMFMVNLEHISYVNDKNVNTSIGRAESIKNDLKALNLGEQHLRQYFVSGCFDGQYIKADVETHLKKILGLPAEFEFYWDFDHVLEIRHKNVIAIIHWAQHTLEFTNQVNNAFAHSEKKTQLMIEQNSENAKNNVKNKSLKGHSKVTTMKFVFFCVRFCVIFCY